MADLLYKLWESTRKVLTALFVVGLVGGSAYAAVVFGNQKEVGIIEGKLDHTQLEIERLKRENRRLKSLIMNLKDSDDLVEKIAREDAGMIRPGEILYLFPHD